MDISTQIRTAETILILTNPDEGKGIGCPFEEGQCIILKDLAALEALTITRPMTRYGPSRILKMPSRILKMPRVYFQIRLEEGNYKKLNGSGGIWVKPTPEFMDLANKLYDRIERMSSARPEYRIRIDRSYLLHDYTRIVDGLKEVQDRFLVLRNDMGSTSKMAYDVELSSNCNTIFNDESLDKTLVFYCEEFVLGKNVFRWVADELICIEPNESYYNRQLEINESLLSILRTKPSEIA